VWLFVFVSFLVITVCVRMHACVQFVHACVFSGLITDSYDEFSSSLTVFCLNITGVSALA